VLGENPLKAKLGGGRVRLFHFKVSGRIGLQLWLSGRTLASLSQGGGFMSSHQLLAPVTCIMKKTLQNVQIP
jgi:hypothetical protein